MADDGAALPSPWIAFKKSLNATRRLRRIPNRMRSTQRVTPTRLGKSQTSTSASAANAQIAFDADVNDNLDAELRRAIHRLDEFLASRRLFTQVRQGLRVFFLYLQPHGGRDIADFCLHLLL